MTTGPPVFWYNSFRIRCQGSALGGLSRCGGKPCLYRSSSPYYSQIEEIAPLAVQAPRRPDFPRISANFRIRRVGPGGKGFLQLARRPNPPLKNGPPRKPGRYAPYRLINSDRILPISKVSCVPSPGPPGRRTNKESRRGDNHSRPSWEAQNS